MSHTFHHSPDISSGVRVTEQLRAEARAYYALCARAEVVGVPVSLGDPRSPATVAGLERAVRDASPEVQA